MRPVNRILCALDGQAAIDLDDAARLRALLCQWQGGGQAGSHGLAQAHERALAGLPGSASNGEDNSKSIHVRRIGRRQALVQQRHAVAVPRHSSRWCSMEPRLLASLTGPRMSVLNQKILPSFRMNHLHCIQGQAGSAAAAEVCSTRTSLLTLPLLPGAPDIASRTFAATS